jgi:hypothetical protein
MKFPKPKQLFENEYPDLNLTQPELIKHFVQDIAYPQANSKQIITPTTRLRL